MTIKAGNSHLSLELLFLMHQLLVLELEPVATTGMCATPYRHGFRVTKTLVTRTYPPAASA